MRTAFSPFPMIPAALITLRETLEASLVVGIVFAFLHRIGERKYDTTVWLGVLAGMLVSFAVAVAFRMTIGEFEGSAEQMYEGLTMFAGAGLLSWMILWMLNQRRTIRREIEGKVSGHVLEERMLGIFLLVLVSTAREGVETVIFLQALLVHADAGMQLFGGLLGIAIAVVASYFLFRGIEIIPLRRMFSVTSVLLVLFAAGLVAHGVHEFQEAGLLPFLTEPLWNLNPAPLSETTYPLLHENGAIGSIFKGLLGYNGNPSGLELIAYAGYLAGVSAVWKMLGTKRA